MKIIIAGAGKVGKNLAGILAAEGHDIAVIEKEAETCYQISNELDVICVEGSATNSEILTEAGAKDADLIIAATEQDEVNMVCGISARKLGTRHVIARVRDTQYLDQSDFLQEALGLSVIINPEYECAKEISRILGFPGAVRVDAFSKSNAELVECRVKPESKLNGLQLSQMPQTFKAKVLVSAVERDGEAVIPKGNFTVKEGDRISIIGSAKELRKLFTAMGEYKKPVKDVIIMGGGRIAVYLAGLLHENGIAVSIIERDGARADELTELALDACIIHGDATRGSVLAEEGINSTGGFVALTGDDGDNIITSIYAANCGVDRVVTKVNREHYADILDNSALDCVVTPKQVIADKIARYVRAMSNSQNSSMETLYRLADGKAEALEFKVTDKSRCVNIPLKDLKLKKNMLVAAIIRGKNTIIPDGSSVILPEDHAIVVTPTGSLKELDDMIEEGIG